MISEGTTCIRSSTATANPTPACPFPYGVTVKPINRPPLSSRAPPLAVSGTFASVWMAPLTVVAFLVGTLRRNPLTTPALIVASCLNDADDADAPTTPTDPPLLAPASSPHRAARLTHPAVPVPILAEPAALDAASRGFYPRGAPEHGDVARALRADDAASYHTGSPVFASATATSAGPPPPAILTPVVVPPRQMVRGDDVVVGDDVPHADVVVVARLPRRGPDDAGAARRVPVVGAARGVISEAHHRSTRLLEHPSRVGVVDEGARSQRAARSRLTPAGRERGAARCGRGIGDRVAAAAAASSRATTSGPRRRDDGTSAVTSTRSDRLRRRDPGGGCDAEARRERRAKT